MVRFLFFIAVSGLQAAFGQTPKERYGGLAVGSSFYTLRDPTVSPLTYRGNPVLIGLSYEKRKSRSFSGWSLTGDLGKLHSKNATALRPMQSTVYRADLFYNHNRWLSDESDRWRWFLGGAWRWHNSIRVTEQNDTGMISFLIANSLEATGGVERTVRLGRKSARLSWMGELPLLSHVIRPSYLNLYNYIDPQNDFLGERLKDARIVTLNRFPALLSTTRLTYPIAGENQLRLTYEWSFYQYDRPFPATIGRHSLSVQLLIRL
ncbi:hypothetical protein [Larkinella soli]|uniref:hypothetical protein n=1 Tax=Larkinella soli TaxID=1770527 RepID=UPI000FFC0356|nr:hypothetical protein [Larkinella soli]